VSVKVRFKFRAIVDEPLATGCAIPLAGGPVSKNRGTACNGVNTEKTLHQHKRNEHFLPSSAADFYTQKKSGILEGDTADLGV
jgi:hypothetical protein